MKPKAVLANFKKKNATAIAAAKALEHPIANKILNALIRANSPFEASDKECIEKIEQQRRIVAATEGPLVDGSLGPGGLYDGDMTISQACKASMPYFKSLYLYYLIGELQPSTILELGTNVGISSCYLASAAKRNGNSRVITLEASPYRARIAKSIHHNLGLDNLSYHTGLFTDTLANALEENSPIDFVFIDGHHQYQPTIDYFQEIFQSATDTAIYLFDDIRWSDGMVKAWNEITGDPRVVFAFDFSFYGIILCSREKREVKAPILKIDIREYKPLSARVTAKLKRMLKIK